MIISAHYFTRKNQRKPTKRQRILHTVSLETDGFEQLKQHLDQFIERTIHLDIYRASNSTTLANDAMTNEKSLRRVEKRFVELIFLPVDED